MPRNASECLAMPRCACAVIPSRCRAVALSCRRVVVSGCRAVVPSCVVPSCVEPSCVVSWAVYLWCFERARLGRDVGMDWRKSEPVHAVMQTTMMVVATSRRRWRWAQGNMDEAVCDNDFDISQYGDCV
eukprot:7120387-Lingulodinium_polyedra.AAC.1